MALRVENLLCVNCSLSCLIPTEPAIPLGNSGANLATGFTQEFQVLVTGAAELKGRNTAETQPVPSPCLLHPCVEQELSVCRG